jgi:N-acetylglucosaminyldiphosphoundecaprenol N-acetyl-beta-D-mannosaminyltransferase
MKTDVLSFLIDCLLVKNCVASVHSWIKQKERKYICAASLHLLMEGLRRASVGDAIRKADLVVPDGMPLVWALRWKGHKKAERVYGPDLMLRLCEEASKKKWNIGLLGGSIGQAERLKSNLESRLPRVSIVCAIDTPSRPIAEAENEKIIQKINKTRPDMLFVGLGCPLQELWMAENVHKIKQGVLIGVGAAFNFITGDVKQAPRWMQRAGLEWLFRISQEPVRLAPRYARIILALLNHLICWNKKENSLFLRI